MFEHRSLGEQGIEVNTNLEIINDESEIEFSFCPALLWQNISLGGGDVGCVSRSINMQFDINFTNSVTAGRV